MKTWTLYRIIKKKRSRWGQSIDRLISCYIFSTSDSFLFSMKEKKSAGHGDTVRVRRRIFFSWCLNTNAVDWLDYASTHKADSFFFFFFLLLLSSWWTRKRRCCATRFGNLDSTERKRTTIHRHIERGLIGSCIGEFIRVSAWFISLTLTLSLFFKVWRTKYDRAAFDSFF